MQTTNIEKEIDKLLKEYGCDEIAQLSEGNTSQRLYFLKCILEGNKQALDDWQLFYKMIAEEYNISHEKYLELADRFYKGG